MTFFRTLSIVAAVSIAAMTPAIGASSDAQRDSHHRATSGSVQLAQAAPGAPAASGMGMGMGKGGMAGMPGHAEQLKEMQAMHDKMMAAKTPDERNALMAEHMQVMHKGMGMGMGMMGRMGPGAMQGAMPGKPGDMAARQNMMEQRMDMMQSMMQMMMDRMPAAPAK